MAVTLTGARLTDAHRRHQAALRAGFTAEFLTVWRLLDPYRLDATTPGWLTVAALLIGQFRAAAAHTSADYLREFRSVELAALDRPESTGTADRNNGTTNGRARERPPELPPLVPDLAGEADPDAVRTSLLVTAPVTIKRLSGQRVPVTEAARAASARAESAAARHVLDGGRATVDTHVTADRRALGWARVTDGDPCWFCAMLASRGPTYHTRASALLREDGKRYHDGCGCTVEPVYSRDAAWPGTGRDWQQLWADVAEGLSADEARLAFRRAVDAQLTSGTSAGTSVPATGTGPEPEPDRADTAAPAGDREELPADDTPAADPFAGTDLAALTDDALTELFAERSADPGTPDDVLDRLLAEMDRREAADEPPAPAPDPLAGIDLTTLPEDELYRLWRDHAPAPGVTERVHAELDRRDQAKAAEPSAPLLGPADEELTDEERRVDELVGQGWEYLDAYAEVHGLDPEELARQERAAALDADRRTGETRDQTVRRLYDEWVHTQWLQAENDTRGNLLTRAAQHAGIDVIELFSGPAVRARKHASEELKRWWADHQRLTYTEFKAQILRRDTDRKAAEQIARRGNDKDFGL